MSRKYVIGFQDEHAAVLGRRFSLEDILVAVAGEDEGAVPAPLLRQPCIQPLSGIGNAGRLLKAQVHIRMLLAETQDALQHGIVIASVSIAVRADKDGEFRGRRFGNRRLVAPGEKGCEEKNGENV